MRTESYMDDSKPKRYRNEKSNIRVKGSGGIRRSWSWRGDCERARERETDGCGFGRRLLNISLCVTDPRRCLSWLNVIIIMQKGLLYPCILLLLRFYSITTTPVRSLRLMVFFFCVCVCVVDVNRIIFWGNRIEVCGPNHIESTFVLTKH